MSDCSGAREAQDVVVVETVELDLVLEPEARGFDLRLEDFAPGPDVLEDELVRHAFDPVELDQRELAPGSIAS